MCLFGGGGGGGDGVSLFLLVLRVVLGGRFYITIFMNFHFQKKKGVGGRGDVIKIKKSKRASLSPGWSFIKSSTAIKNDNDIYFALFTNSSSCLLQSYV